MDIPELPELLEQFLYFIDSLAVIYHGINDFSDQLVPLLWR